MKQTALCVPLDVKPESRSRLSAILEELCREEDVGAGGHPHNFARVGNAMPTLHFMSMSVFPSAAYDPIFILEANFDGPPGVFWGQFEAAFGDKLRDILRCCKRPLDEGGPLFDAVTSPGARAPIAPYFEARTQRPSAWHQGNRGLGRNQILEEARLFASIQEELDAPVAGKNPYRGAAATAVHQRLRERMLVLYPWLNERAPKRIESGERAADILRLLLFGLSVLLLLMLPGVVVSALLMALLARSPIDVGDTLLYSLLGGLASLVAVIPIILLWIRYIERRDSSHDAPDVDEQMRREMARREDWIVQNHMGSIVLLKPGVLRAILVRALHRGLGLLVRVTATNGYLASMRTIHFAHWAFLNNRSRLLFFSNFDHSWESYLDDFIEKAHGGLTLAWCSGVGFPPTRFLMYEGASQGRRFKEWGLSTRVANRFWYSAYPHLTVDQIERNNRIATVLRLSHVTEEDARLWMRDL